MANRIGAAVMPKSLSALNGMVVVLLSLNLDQTPRAQNAPDVGAFSPDAIEYDYVLDQVRARGARGSEYEQYAKECNDRGICRYTGRLSEDRKVVYDTPFGEQTVLYPAASDRRHSVTD